MKVWSLKKIPQATCDHKHMAKTQRVLKKTPVRLNYGPFAAQPMAGAGAPLESH